jgi:uncharacterized YceG family protein
LRRTIASRRPVAERSERTAAEREAARLERERRRTGQAPATPQPTEPPPPDPELLAPDPEPPAPEPEPPAPEPEPLTSDPVDDPPSDHVGELQLEPPPPEPAGRRPGRRAERQPRTRTRTDTRTREAKPHSSRRRLLALIPLVLAAALVWFLIELFQPFGGSPHGRITVKIPSRSTSSQIGDLLAGKGVISSSFFFELRATLAGERSDLRSGTFHLQYGMSYGSVLTALTKAPPAAKVTQLTLIPGKSRGQIDALLRSQKIKGSYLADTRHSPLLNPVKYGAPRKTPMLEGFLFPSTYQLFDPIQIPQLVAKQLQAFKQSFASIKFGYAERHHLTPYDVLIIASMIEGEASTEQDRRDVASVIYNRLKNGMPLQLDATTRYATDNYTKPLTQSQLNSKSPYNTRNHAGLPPTPIDNPSLASMQAAANPANTNYLYFVVKPCGNGAEVFTGNYQQFLKESQQYQNARAARGGRSPTHC